MNTLDHFSTDEFARLRDAAQLIVETQFGSVSMLQRKLRLGFGPAAKVMDGLEELRVVGPSKGTSPRDVLIRPEGLDLLGHAINSEERRVHGER